MNPTATSKPAILEKTVPTQILRAETNFLRFPLFALGTKNLRQIDFREYQGTRTVTNETGDKQKVEFTYRVSRNTDHQFPGPLARKIHFALLAIFYRQSHPYQNPVKFKWRELAREMDISFSGNKIQRMKDAIKSIHGVLIHSEHALIDGESRHAVRRERGLHLYSQYIFQSEMLPEGQIADANYVYFDDWYLDNLNAFYTVKLDYELWKRLNDASTITSRLYEFVLFLFGTQNERQISYRKLARCMPVTEMSRPSHAVNQFEKPLQMLVKEKVITGYHWKRGVDDLVVELRRRKTKRINPVNDKLDESETITSTVERLTDYSPSDRILRDFYRRWLKIENPIPADKEKQLAQQLVDEYGYEVLNSVLGKVIATLKVNFANARSFTAAKLIFEQLASKEASRKTNPSQSNTQAEATDITPEQRHKVRAAMKARWNQLPQSQQTKIKAVVKRRFASSSPKPEVFLLQCMLEMDRNCKTGSFSES